MRGDPSQATISTALAFLHITQSVRGLHMDTRLAMMDYYVFADRSPYYRLNLNGVTLAEKSKLWRAHQWLTQNGFVLRGDTQKLRLITFLNPNDGRTGWTNKQGDLFVGNDRVNLD